MGGAPVAGNVRTSVYLSLHQKRRRDMTQSLVSIILTVFDRVRYLEEAINSALGQTYRNLEVLVTDDANSKAVREIVGKYGSDSRIRYRKNDSVLGAPLNIRAALNEVSGEYVVILNDDDVMEPQMVEALLPPLNFDSNSVVSFGDHWIVDEAGEISLRETDINTKRWGRDRISAGKIDNPLHLALRGGIPFVMGTVFRRAACSDSWLTREIEGAYDSWLALQLALSNRPFYFNPTRIFRYRVHAASESARLSAEKANAQMFIFSQLLHDPRADKERSFIRKTLAHFQFVLGRDRLYFGNRELARAAFLNSLRHAISLRAAIGALFTFVPITIQRWVLQSWRNLRRIKADLPNSVVQR
jgi:glycosyltransferase involved in cell wall biosynthesis